MVLIMMFIYIFIPIPASLVIYALSFFLRGKKTYWLLLWSVLTFSLLILLYIPSVEDDAYRYFQVLSQLQSISGWQDLSALSETNQLIEYQSSSIGFTALEMFVSRTAYFNLLPYINTVICLFSLLFPFVDLKERGKISGFTAIFLSLPLPLLYNFLNTASTMRWALACSLFFLIIYIFFERVKKRRYIWLFFIPIIFHTGIILGVANAVYVALIKKISAFKIIVPVLFLIFYFKISNKIGTNLSNNLFSQILNMTNTYSTDFMERSANGQLFVYLLRTLAILSMIMGLIIYYGVDKKERRSGLGRMMLFFTVMQLTLIGYSMIFSRYIMVIVPLALIYIARYVSVTSINIKNLIFASNSLAILVGCIVCYANVKRMGFTLSVLELCLSNLYHLLINIPIY
ncbi:EpsG family protein [Weissella paramesenteroides]|uniref:EpsG family protein n=1 Tax=Weissella paramesenteroides ATCC 33313 TaxID=585506 RepID=C5RB64_WEIPA|nr:EpsG family protein [Weissella paramesenteroides]ATF41865.1 polymerase [Weissella paramesenteroides]EER74733.1 hypothetical protein HMPREF0877_1209 [Weissella paramesenteroides ATCC 33313]